MDPFGLEPCNFFSGLGHTVLNLLGLIPGVGDVFDITNAGWYIAEGRWDKAFEAGIAALPFFGSFMPDTGLFRYLKRGLNIASYGGTGFLAGQGMWEGGQALWEEINSKDCSGWRIAGNIVGIGLNGVSLFLSGKGLFSETKALNEILKEDGIYDKLKLDNGGYVNLEFFFGSSKISYGKSSLKFGDNDLVYGPSANRKLRELQETAGGKLLSDIGYPAKEGYSDWLSYSKSVMDATTRNGNMIHFDLTYMDDIENILNNTGNYANTVTAGELRYIRDNWSRFEGYVKFYNNGVEVLPPWMK